MSASTTPARVTTTDSGGGRHRSPNRPFRLRRTPGGGAHRPVLGNLIARVIALVSLTVVTILTARWGGADDVGVLTLLRILPGLIGVLASSGLPGTMGYFLAGPDAKHPALWPTILTVLAGGALVGTALWLALAPVVQSVLLPTTSLVIVLATGATVSAQLLVAVGKAALQGIGDSRGASVTTAAEEAAYLPVCFLALAAGVHGHALIVTSLLGADVVVAAWAWHRLSRRSAVFAARRPERALLGRLLRFGFRNQIGGIVGLLNLRLDFLVLGSLAGPGAVGVYAVASKYAELVRLPALAVSWVTYPEVARAGAAGAPAGASRRLRPLLGAGIAAALVLAVAAGPLFPAVYGADFGQAVWPAVVILGGLVLEPAAGAATAYLLGTGRPGTNSAILGLGLAVTVVLDLALIPRYGALGAAWASAAAYLLTDLALLAVVRRLREGSR